MTDGRKPLRDLLERHGINPRLVAEDGLSEFGYNTFLVDEAGEPRRPKIKAPRGWSFEVLSDPEFGPAIEKALAWIEARVDFTIEEQG